MYQANEPSALAALIEALSDPPGIDLYPPRLISCPAAAATALAIEASGTSPTAITVPFDV
jgi:hypothetical protein